jgi:chemotaxis protein MotD
MMIDLSALGLAVAQRTSGDKRDQADPSQADDQDARKFGDYVNEASKKNNGKHGAPADAHQSARIAANDDVAEIGDADALDQSIDVDDLPAIDGATAIKTKLTKDDARLVPAKIQQDQPTDETSATGVDDQTADVPAEGASDAKSRLALGLLQMGNVTSVVGQDPAKGATAAATDSETENKTASNDGKVAATSKLNAAKQADQVAVASPAQELHALLAVIDGGETAAKDEVPAAAARKTKSDDQDATADDVDLTAAETPVVAAKVEPVAAVQSAAQHAASILTIKAVATDAADGADNAQADNGKLAAISLDGKAHLEAMDTTKTDGDGEADASGGKNDIVTVLDARRYLGFSTDTTANAGANAGALATAMRGDTSWAQAIQNAKHGGEATATVVNTLKLQMSPEHLGNMTASLRLKGEELSVEVRVETMDAYRQLSGDQDGIVKALQKHGFAIDQVTVQLSPVARADSGQTGGDSSQNSGGNGQNTQDGSQGETTRQREDGARRNANQSNWIGNDRNSTSSDSGNGSDDTGTGNLYL